MHQRVCNSYITVTATMGTHRTLEKERRDSLFYSKQRSLSQLSNVERISDRVVTEECGQIDTTIDLLHDIVGVISIVEFRMRNEFELLPTLGTRPAIAMPKWLRSKPTLVCV